MDLDKQVTSLEFSRRLKAAGIAQHSYWYYSTVHPTPELKSKHEHPIQQALTINPHWMDDIFSAFTVAELGELLPRGFDGAKAYQPHVYSVRVPEFNTPVFTDENEANARAKLLLYLVEKGLLKPQAS